MRIFIFWRMFSPDFIYLFKLNKLINLNIIFQSTSD